MIEQIMYFMLGVLIATLVALLVLPAVWHRAVRLTTKRVEAAVPISIFEVQADKDQQRAFFALNQRRLELQSDTMRATIVAHAAEIETQRRRIFDLEGELKALQAQHAIAQASGAERDVVLGETQDQLADRTAAVARLEQELADRTGALAALDDAHRTLTAHAGDLVAAAQRIATLEAETQQLAARLADTARRLEDATATLDAERTAAAEQRIIAANAATELSTDLAETQEALALKADESDARASSIAALEAERDRLAAALATAEMDLDANRAVVHAFEQRRATEFASAEAENRRLAETLHMLRADHALMEEAVQRPRRDAAAEPMAAAPAAEALDGTAVLRETVADLAARLVALTARLEGPGSPTRSAVEGGAGDLAARIRELLDQDAAQLDRPDLETPGPSSAPNDLVGNEEPIATGRDTDAVAPKSKRAKSRSRTAAL